MRHIALAAALAVAGSAQAAVVYNWQTVDPANSIFDLFGRIEVTDDAWRTGEIVHTYSPTCRSSPMWCDPGPQRPDYSDPSSPVLMFQFFSNAPVFGGPFDQDSRHGVNVDFQAGTGVFSASGGGFFSLELGQLIDGGPSTVDYEQTLLSVNDTQQDVSMTANDGLWTIEHFASDAGPYCDYSPNWNSCSGVTGRWVLDQSTVPAAAAVPLPGTLALLGLGAVLVTSRRRKAA